LFWFELRFRPTMRPLPRRSVLPAPTGKVRIQPVPVVIGQRTFSSGNANLKTNRSGLSFRLVLREFYEE